MYRTSRWCCRVSDSEGVPTVSDIEGVFSVSDNEEVLLCIGQRGSADAYRTDREGVLLCIRPRGSTEHIGQQGSIECIGPRVSVARAAVYRTARGC